MTTHSDAALVTAFLAATRRRVLARALLFGAAAGLAMAAAIVAIVNVSSGPRANIIALAGALTVTGLLGGWLFASAQRQLVAALIERRVPQSRNLVITAAELLDRGEPTDDAYVPALVLREASALVRSLSAASLVPLPNALVVFVAAAAVAVLVASRPHASGTGPIPVAPRTVGIASVSSVTAELMPPQYVGRPRRTLDNPARIEAFAGSQIHLAVQARADSVAIETVHGRVPMAVAPSGGFVGDVTADADGYIAIEPMSTTSGAGTRRLIGLSLTQDAPPSVQITAPGHDIKLVNGHHTIDVTIAATDDIGLASLRLRYTRVSGSGERFTFTQGDVPLAITRSDPRHWNARAAWRLDSLGLEAGDIVVYRAVAADNRPGAVPSESDSYIAEVLAPGSIAAPGFAIDPDVERYALSQQMVIVKTERLIARKPALAADTLADAAAEIAAEQRGVRAEFVFMMGGEIGGADDAIGDLNEEAEAAGESDLAAGRMLNQGRAALLSAIRLMSRANKALTVPDLSDALTQERAALVQLERTFSHSHLILRALTQRERLDLTRRLSGALTEAARDAEPSALPTGDPRETSLRQSLADIVVLAHDSGSTAERASRVNGIAERLLRGGTTSPALQDVAAQLSKAATAISDSRSAAARELLDAAATALAEALRADLITAPEHHADLGADRLAGSLTDALRAGHQTP